MNSTPTFSIITPSFNQLDLLVGCVFSVAAQVRDGCTVEHIIQDGGTAGVDGLAATFGAEFYSDGRLIAAADTSRCPYQIPKSSGYSLKIFSGSDGGMYDAINKGLLKSHGRFCAWLNCDERYTEGALRDIAYQFETIPPPDAVFGDMVVIDAGSRPLCYRRGIVQNERLLTFAALNISSCSLFFRRELVDRRLLLDPAWKVIGDKEWISRLIRAGIRFRQFRKPVACFRLLANSLTASPQAITEKASLARLQGTPSLASKLTLKIFQVVRKFFAGCYWPRYVDLRVTESSGDCTRIGPAWVSFRWPKSV